MATVTLQRIRPFQHGQTGAFGGAVTGNMYVIDALGRVTVDVLDAAYMIPHGWDYLVPGSGGGTVATSGVATLDFGAFPGSAQASLVVANIDIADPNAELDAWIIPVATVDHTADEHTADPPRITAQLTPPGTSFTINGFPSGRDLPVPPGTPFGNTANSQLPIGQQQLMPSGKWSVAWAFSP